MLPEPKIKTWQERSEHLLWIQGHLDRSARGELGLFWVFSLEFGRWLLDGRKCGTPWTAGFFPRLQDLLVALETTNGDPSASMAVRAEIQGLSREILRVNGYVSMQFAHRGMRPRPRPCPLRGKVNRKF